MTLLTNFLNKAIIVLLILFVFPGFLHAQEVAERKSRITERNFHIAVFPVQNLSGTAAPLKEIRQAIIERLRRQGLSILEEEALEKFMMKYRIRYVGGIDRGIAKAFREEMGIQGVLITSLALYSEVNFPRVALTSRLVSTGHSPSILWIDGRGMAGDDSPGILGLGLVEDPKALLEKAIGKLTGSVEVYLDKNSKGENVRSVKRKFRPKVSYRSEVLDPNSKYTVAVAPFLNFSGRRNAGEILELQFIRNLKKFEQFDVVEPGVVRQQLLALRMITPEGISLANADDLFASLNVDLILTANVFEYQDYQGVFGNPKVDFLVQLIEKKSRSVVWSAVSHNEGDDGVFFFDRGKVNTAHAMASQMTQWIGEKLIEHSKTVQGTKGSNSSEVR